MVQGTTPTHTFTLPFSTEEVGKAKIIYAQGDEVIVEKTDPAMDGNTLTVRLTQKETLNFDVSKAVQIQVRILTREGDALARDVITVGVGRCLEKEELV